MITILLGEQNSGKTLSMSYFAREYFNQGYKIYSNYNLNFKHEKITKELLESYVYNKVQFEKAVFCIDEIYLFMDSRSFGSKQVKIFSYFVLQTSKRNVHLFGTAQYFNTVEKRLRENCNINIYCCRVLEEEDNYIEVNSNVRILPKKQIEKLYIKLSFIIKSYIDGIIPNHRNRIMYLKAKPLFNIYDTKELLGLE